MTQNPIASCPAPRTASAELLTALSQGRPIAMAPGSAPSTSSAELHAVADELRGGDASGIPLAPGVRCTYCSQVGNGCSLARCRNPAPVIPPAQPAPPAATDNRRVVTATCSCARRYKGERWAPPSVSELSLSGTADQDIADAVGIAQCRLRSLQVMAERDGLSATQVTVQGYEASMYIDNAEKHLLTPRGIKIVVEHPL